MTFHTAVRILLISLIEGIIIAIPDKERSIRREFIRLRESLPYKAPELLSGILMDIHTLLDAYVPIHSDDAQNPLWKKNIQRLWNHSIQDFITMHTPPQNDSQSTIP